MYLTLLNKKAITLLLLGILSLVPNSQILAQIPAGYYNDAEGLTGNDLKTALNGIISGHKTFPYTSSSTDVWDILKESDRDPNNSSNVILLYTGWSVDAEQEYNGGSGWNREHVWAKSHGDFGTNPPAGTDCHHLRPTDDGVNSARSNKDFDNGGSFHSVATECRFTDDTWEPRDAVKGDVARMMFYMAVRYEGENGVDDLELVDYVTGSTSEPIFGVLSTLLEWHSFDPVDDFERNRNNVVYSYQNNRNPFTDHPEYVNAIWGGNPASSISNIVTTPASPNIDEEVSISATITDAEGISSVKLTWGMSSSAMNNEIIMTNSSGSEYITSTAIPGQAEKTEVFYQIVVVDNTNESTSSDIKSYYLGNPIVYITLLDEDFETQSDEVDITLNGWTNYIEAGSEKWYARLYGENLYAQLSSYKTGEENVAWLVSPKIDLSSVTDPEFSFDINVGYWNHEGIAIFISIDFDGSNISSATWNDITSNFTIPSKPADDYGTFTTAGTLDLSTYDDNIYVAFKYSGNENTGQTTTYQVDNVLIKGISNEDEEDTTPPTLTFSPSDGQQDVAINSTIQVDANEAIFNSNLETIDNAYLQAVINLTKTSEDGETISFDASINENNKQITLTPITVLDKLTTYYLSIDANSFSDTDGNVLSEKQSIAFTTHNEDNTPPTLSFSPSDGQQDVAINTTIQIDANEAIFNSNLETIDNTYLQAVINLTKTSEDGETISLEASINENNKQITLTPTTVLDKLTTYYLSIDANSFSDTDGNVLSEKQSIAFTTKDDVDSYAPELILNQLSENLKEVVFEFNEQISSNKSSYAELKSNLLLSIDGTNFNALNDKDTVYVDSILLKVDLSEALTASINIFKINANTLMDDTGNIVSQDILSNSFNASGNDSIAPEFINGYPQISNITSNTFRLIARINEPGKLYYKIATGENIPTVSELLNEEYIAINTANQVTSFVFGQLDEYTNYQLYYILADNIPKPNVSKSVSFLNVKTKGTLPEITSTLKDTTVCTNSFIDFIIKVNSSSPLQFQWYFNDSILASEVNDTLQLFNTTLKDAGQYHCLINNEVGSITSEKASLSVMEVLQAGNDSSVVIMDTIFSYDITQLISKNASKNGRWIDSDDSRALVDQIFYPSLAGYGTFNFDYVVENQCNTDTARISITTKKAEVIGINNFANNSFNIYPNPNKGDFYIESNNKIENLKISVYTVDGKEISASVKTYNNVFHVNMPLKTGIYIVHIANENSYNTQKIVVQ